MSARGALRPDAIDKALSGIDFDGLRDRPADMRFQVSRKVRRAIERGRHETDCSAFVRPRFHLPLARRSGGATGARRVRGGSDLTLTPAMRRSPARGPGTRASTSASAASKSRCGREGARDRRRGLGTIWALLTALEAFR